LTRRLELVEGACAGLAHAHRAGVVHLDVKPDNLMLDDSGVVKVLDFGIARVLQGEALATRHLAGTLRYMSPEQIGGRPLDRRTDVFSLGCSLFELVAYSPAYVGSTQEIVTRIAGGPVPLLIDAIPDLDPRLDAITRRAMALEPSDRYDDLEELRDELGRLRAEIDTAADARFAQPIAIVSENASTTFVPVGQPTPRPSSFREPSRSSTSAPRASVDRPRRFQLIASIAAVAAFVVGVASFLILRTPTLDSRIPSPESRLPSLDSRIPSPESRVSSPEPAEPKDTTANEEVWRRLARGDRDGVIQLLRSPAPTRGPTQGGQLAADVFEALRASVLQARQKASASSRAALSEPYRSGEERFARATRLEADGRAIEALGALWQAADLYAQSVAIGDSQPPRNPPSLAQGSSSLGAASSSEPTSSPSPEPTLGSGRIAQAPPQPATDVPRPEAVTPPAAETTSAIRAPSPAPEPPKASSDAEAVLETLRRYQAAYQALDVSRVQQVFPSLGRDQVEQLRRTFAGMTAYEIEIRNPRVDVQTDMAAVQAVVARRMVPRVGKPVANEVETVFRFRRDGTGWVITVVTAQ
jgi:serine/threonine protein kinase